MNPWILFFLASLVVVGYGITFLLDVRLTPEERLSFGTLLGVITVSTVAFPLAWIYTLNRFTVVLACIVSLALSSFGWHGRVADTVEDWKDFGRRLRLPLRDGDNPAPWLALTALGTGVSVRVMMLAYNSTAQGGVSAGHLSTYGDWSAHLAYAASFAYGDNFPPEQPTAAGSDFVYHFGIDFFSALFVPLGLDLFGAMQVSTGMLAIAFPAIMYCAARRLVRSRAAAVLGTLLFLLAGATAAGWERFVGDDMWDGWRVIWNLPRLYAFDSFTKMWVDNSVTGFLYPQRPTLIGFPLTLMVLSLLAPRLTGGALPSRRGLAILGIFVGLLPYWHIFALPIIGGLVALWWAFDRFRLAWLAFLVPTIVVSVPLLLLVRPPDSGRDWKLWWARGLDGSWWGPADIFNIPGFWLYQTGVFLPLLAIALLHKGLLPRRLALAFAPIWVLFVMTEIALWHHHPLNNSKYIAFLALLGAPFVAALLVSWFRRRGLPAVLAGMVVVFSCLTGFLDIWSAMDRTSVCPGGCAYPVQNYLTASDLLVGRWAREHTDERAVFLALDQNVSPIAALSGRQVVIESVGRLSDLGIDYTERFNDALAILDQGDGFRGVIEKYAVDYVVLGPKEQSTLPEAAVRWRALVQPVYDLGGYLIFPTAALPPDGSAGVEAG